MFYKVKTKIGNEHQKNKSTLHDKYRITEHTEMDGCLHKYLIKYE